MNATSAMRMKKASTRSARLLRRTPTDAERLLWYWLRAHRFNGVKVRRQHPVGPFLLDLAIPSHRIAIELDGGGHTDPEQAAYDASRDAYLTERRWTILRFWNHDVLFNTAVVLEAIRNAVERTSPLPCPSSLSSLPSVLPRL